MWKLLKAWTVAQWHIAAAQDSYDFIIVGGGAAGLVLASRLSEQPSFSVLVLEAGNNHADDIKVKCPGTFASMYGDPEYDWNYTNSPQPYLANRTHANIAGKGLGGGNSVNFMWWTHASRQDIDNWGALGNANWTWEVMQPYLKESEAYTAPSSQKATQDLQTQYIDPDSHGTQGPIINSFPVTYGPFLEAWPRTFQGIGAFPDGDPRGGEALGGHVNLFNIDPKTNERSYPVTGYYMPASRRPNLKVITGAFATRILLDHDSVTKYPKATGVSYVKNNLAYTVLAKKEVILSAGAMQSPKLLELSGIGDCDRLSRFGIACLVNNTNVGENFQNHLMLPLGWEVIPGVTTTDDFSSPTAFNEALAEYEATRSGPFSTVNGSSALLSLSQLNVQLAALGNLSYQPNLGLSKVQHDLHIANLRSNQTSAVQEILLTGGISPWYHNDSARVFASPANGGNYATIIGLLSHPFSRGSAHIQSANPAVQLQLDPRYLSHPLDRALSVELAFNMQALGRRPPLSRLLRRGRDGSMVLQPGYLPEDGGARELTAANVDAFVAQRMLIAYHHSGTCAMLPREGGGVVDERLRVYGVAGLRVVDMSVFPMLMQGTPTSLVLAVAERAADFVKEEFC